MKGAENEAQCKGPEIYGINEFSEVRWYLYCKKVICKVTLKYNNAFKNRFILYNGFLNHVHLPFTCICIHIIVRKLHKWMSLTGKLW